MTSDPATTRLLHAWPATGPALLAILLVLRTLLADGLELGIGLGIAAALAAVAVVAGRRMRWAAAALLLGPVAFVASPARTELSFNLSRPGDTTWYVFTWAVAAGIGLSLAAAIVLARPRPWTRRAVVPIAVLAAVGWAVLVTSIDPQPDLGGDLDATERAALADVALVNYAYGLPPLEVVDGRLRARLRNDSDLPHTFTVDALDLDVYVPAGRDAVVDVAVPEGIERLDVYCAIGDHRDLGMVATVTPLVAG